LRCRLCDDDRWPGWRGRREDPALGDQMQDLPPAATSTCCLGISHDEAARDRARAASREANSGYRGEVRSTFARVTQLNTGSTAVGGGVAGEYEVDIVLRRDPTRDGLALAGLPVASWDPSAAGQGRAPGRVRVAVELHRLEVVDAGRATRRRPPTQVLQRPSNKTHSSAVVRRGDPGLHRRGPRLPPRSARRGGLLRLAARELDGGEPQRRRYRRRHRPAPGARRSGEARWSPRERPFRVDPGCVGAC
jgi:hypothetical protein